jgi:hypothetical protein
MSRRKHANARAFDPKGDPIENQIRADLGTLAPFHQLAVVVRILREQYQRRDEVLKAGKRAPDIHPDILKLHGYPKISQAAAMDKALKLEDDLLEDNRQKLHNFLDHAIFSADHEAVRAFADILEKEKNNDWEQGDGLSHPTHYQLARFKWLADLALKNNPADSFVTPWPPTSTRLRRWIKDRTGKDPGDKEVREAARQIGLPIAKRGRPKKK